MVTLVTFESVAAAAEVIDATGKRPSVRAIAAALGGGSPNSILMHLRDWQSGRPVARIADMDIDAQIIDGIKKQMQRIAAGAAATAEEKAAATEDDLQAVSAEQAQAKQQIETLTDELDKSRYQVNALTKKVETQQADAERFAQTAQLAYAALREDMATERQKFETTAAALVRAEVRLEALPKLESEIRKMEAEIETLRAAFDSMQQAKQQTKQQAEQATAVANANLNAANQRTQDVLERLNKAEAKVEAAAKESVALNVMLQAAQAMLEASGKEIEVLKQAEQKVKIEPKGKVGRPSKNPAKHPIQPDGNDADYETMPLALQA